MDEREPYVAYMLRLWQAGHDDGPAWHASLESPHTAEHQVFPSVQALFDFLLEKTAELHQPEQGAQTAGCKQRVPGLKSSSRRPTGNRSGPGTPHTGRELQATRGGKR